MNKENQIEDRYTRVFGAYDIRGTVGDDLDSPTVKAIARAYGYYRCPKALLLDKRRVPLADIESISEGLSQE